MDATPSGLPNSSTAKKLRASISRAWEIVESLLLFADLQRNDPGSAWVSINLHSLLKNLIAHYASQWEDKQLTVNLSVDPEAESVRGNPELLETAFKHLLLNAIRFNKKGGEVIIQAKNEGNSLCISFADTGIGIPKDKMSMIFDSFYQVAEYLTREVGGLGLGLAIVRRIVEAHGGMITVSSREGKGSEFKMLLPSTQRSLTNSSAERREVLP